MSATAPAGTNDSEVTSAQFRARGGDVLLQRYRDWLESELKLLGNASHHAYALGQANMAKRALERFDIDCGPALERERAAAADLGAPAEPEAL
jgi:hypothetical protein